MTFSVLAKFSLLIGGIVPLFAMQLEQSFTHKSTQALATVAMAEMQMNGALGLPNYEAAGELFEKAAQ